MIRALSDAVTDTSFIPPDDNYTSSDPSDIPNFNPPTGDPSDPSSSDSFPTFSNDSFSLSDYDKLVYQADVVYNLNNWLSVVSIVGGLIVLIVMISIWLYDRKLVNRVSLRLTAVISFVDILAAISVIAYTRVSGEDNIGCMILGWTLSFLPQCYLFLTVMIAFNLQVGRDGKKKRVNGEKINGNFLHFQCLSCYLFTSLYYVIANPSPSPYSSCSSTDVKLLLFLINGIFQPPYSSPSS